MESNTLNTEVTEGIIKNYDNLLTKLRVRLQRNKANVKWISKTIDLLEKERSEMAISIIPSSEASN